MSRLARLAFGLLAVPVLSGCVANNTPEAWANREAATKIALVNGKPSRAYTVIKPVSVHLVKGPPQYGGDLYISDAQKALQLEAQAAGADAVIETKYHDEPVNFLRLGPSGWGWVDGSGIAVKYK